jgi:hypothetical protein
VVLTTVLSQSTTEHKGLKEKSFLLHPFVFCGADYSLVVSTTGHNRGEGEIIHKEENRITRKLTECIQENRSSGVTGPRQQPPGLLYSFTNGTT